MAKRYPKAYVLTGRDYESRDIMAVLIPPKRVNYDKLRRSWEHENGPIERHVADPREGPEEGARRIERMRAFADWLVEKHGFRIAQFDEHCVFVGGARVKPWK